MINEISVTQASLRFAAMNLLSMREHTALELHNKLLKKFGPNDLIGAVVGRLREQGLQSDERFAEAFVSMRKRNGKGASLIKMELRARGVSEELIARYVDDADSAWLCLAVSARIKRFGGHVPTDIKEKARQVRFLQARGFSAMQIRLALSGVEIDDY
jgi:regulatory protein